MREMNVAIHKHIHLQNFTAAENVHNISLRTSTVS